MNTMETPNYIKSLLTPTTKQPQGRKVWSIDLQQVWLPFFTATNTMGDTAIPSEAIGCPLRLGYDKAGQVRFSQAGRPVIRIAKEIADNVRLVRENFTAGLQGYANMVITQNPEGYKAEVEKAREAGQPIVQKDKANLEQAIAKAMEEAIEKSQAKGKAKKKEKELVPA